jgi:hypothetical protein
MQKYNVGAAFERTAIDIAGPFPKSESGNRYLLIPMDYFNKWQEVYDIPNQQASIVADAPVTNFFCRSAVTSCSDQGRNVRISANARGTGTSWNNQDTDHPSAPALR